MAWVKTKDSCVVRDVKTALLDDVRLLFVAIEDPKPFNNSIIRGQTWVYIVTLNFKTFKLDDSLEFVEIEKIFSFKPRRKNWVRLCWNCFRTNEYSNAFETGLIHGKIVAHAWKLSQNVGLTFITCSLRTCQAIIGVQQHNKLKFVRWRSVDGARQTQ